MDTTHVLPLRSEGRTRTVEMSIEYAEKDLVVTMSDPCDPVFLYYLRIDDASFLRIKQAQSLLVDFPQFPSMLVDLLRRSNGSDGSFFANLSGAESNSPSLRIVETNAFRQIVHLDLNLVPASDSTIKQHLSELCLKLKEENANLKKDLTAATDKHGQLSTSSNLKLNDMMKELETIKLNHSSDVSQLKLAHSQEIAKEKELFQSEKERLRLDAERQKKELQTMYDLEMKELSLKVTSLNTTNSHLLSQNQTHEATISSLKSQLETVQREHSNLRMEHEKNQSLQTVSEREKATILAENVELKSQVKTLESKLEQNNQAYRDMSTQLQMLEKDSLQFKEKYESQKSQLEMLEESLQKAAEEINKGNEIISRFQGDIKSYKTKIKLKNTVALQQEKLLEEKTQLTETQLSEIKSLKEDISRKITEISQLNEKNADLTKKLEDQRQTLQENNNVIEWLHKQLNEQTMGRPNYYESKRHFVEQPFEVESIAISRASPNPLNRSVNSLKSPQGKENVDVSQPPTDHFSSLRLKSNGRLGNVLGKSLTKTPSTTLLPQTDDKLRSSYF